MSERKVLTKYYPPDFDPSAITRTRGPKQAGPKVQTVRLMAPFSMKCTSCGEFIYKGRKFNARKETTDERYFSIAIYRFYIRCTRCSGEITFKTDPKNMDYECEKGAKRNFEVWRQAPTNGELESEEDRLERLEREESERGAMALLETKVGDAKQEMAIADALDEIRTRNARNERAAGREVEIENMREEREEAERRIDAEAARLAFTTESGERVRRIGDEVAEWRDTDMILGDRTVQTGAAAPDIDSEKMPPPTFKRVVKKKRDMAAALGIRKKENKPLV